MTQTRKHISKRVENQRKSRSTHRGEQKIKLNTKEHSLLPPLPLPYPPTTRVDKFVEKLISKPKLARFPNAFIMYRNEYVQYLKAKGLNLPMTELSPMIAHSWKQEPSCVKDAYTKISSEAEKLYVQIIAINQLSQSPDPLTELPHEYEQGIVKPSVNFQHDSPFQEGYIPDYSRFLGESSPVYFSEYEVEETRSFPPAPYFPWFTDDCELLKQRDNESSKQGQPEVSGVQIFQWTDASSIVNPNDYMPSSPPCSRSSSPDDDSKKSSSQKVGMSKSDLPTSYISFLEEDLTPTTLSRFLDAPEHFISSPSSQSNDSIPRTPGSPLSSIDIYEMNSSAVENEHELTDITTDIFCAIDSALSLRIYDNLKPSSQLSF